MKLTISSIKDAKGDTIATSNIGGDISTQKLAEEKQAVLS
jgi:hypothetical protein